MNGEPKLIVHVGHGKTGSSSIQNSLVSSKDILSAARVNYLGMLFEHAQDKKRETWQRRTGSNEFFYGRGNGDRAGKVYRILSGEIARARQEGLRTLIWSNEWVLLRPEQIIGPLKRLKDEGHDVEIQCYVRRHDAWAQSAYIQWAIKHKGNEGNVIPFRNWRPQFLDLGFARALQPWHDVFGPSLRVFNYDLCGDVVEHFARVNGLPNLVADQTNFSPTSEELQTWALYSDEFAKELFPAAFERILAQAREVPAERLERLTIQNLMPSDSDLGEIAESVHDDALRVNELLAENGEPPLSFEKPLRTVAPPDPGKLVDLLSRIVLVLNSRLVTIDESLAALGSNASGQSSAQPEVPTAETFGELLHKLEHIRSHPLRNLRDYMKFHALRFFSRLVSGIAPSLAARLSQSAARKDPRRGLLASVIEQA